MLPNWYCPWFLDGTWMELKPIPLKYQFCAQPIATNNNQIIIVPENSWHRRDTIKGIYRYDTVHDKWTQMLKCKALRRRLLRYTAAFDETQQMLYILNPNDSVLEINMTTQTFNYSPHSIDIGLDTQSTIINNNFHIIGGVNNNKHLVYNTKYKQIIPIHTFNEYPRGFSGRIIHIKSQKKLLLFVEETDAIYAYDIKTFKWNKLNIKMPITRAGFGVATVMNEQFVLIFGGQTWTPDSGRPNWPRCDDIWIFSLCDETFKKSLIKCPQKSVFKAVTLPHGYQDELVTFGYMRTECKRLHIGIDIPFHVSNRIKMYYCEEYVHLFGAGLKHHWKIKVQNIMDNSSYILGEEDGIIRNIHQQYSHIDDDEKYCYESYNDNNDFGDAQSRNHNKNHQCNKLKEQWTETNILTEQLLHSDIIINQQKKEMKQHLIHKNEMIMKQQNEIHRLKLMLLQKEKRLHMDDKTEYCCDLMRKGIQVFNAFLRNIPPESLNRSFDKCYSCECMKARNDKLVYYFGVPPQKYVLPTGCIRIGIKTDDGKAKMNDVWRNWNAAFHGTDLPSLTQVFQSGLQLLKPGDKTINGKELSMKDGHIKKSFSRYNHYTKKQELFDPNQIFVSPSIKYALNKIYAPVYRFEDFNVQFGLQLRIRSNSFGIGHETIRATQNGTVIDEHYDNNELEWYTKENVGIFVHGVLIKVTADSKS